MSLDWLQSVEKTLIDLDQIPILGKAPPFNWKALTLKLRDLLQIEDLELTPHEFAWRESDELLQSLGEHPLCLNISMLPLQGHVSALVAAQDFNSFASWVVEHKAGSNTLLSPHFTDGLFHFVSLEVLKNLQSDACFDGFLMRILSNQLPPSSHSLVFDVSLKAYKEVLNFKLVVPEPFRKNWIQHFAARPMHIPQKMRQSVEVLCSVEAASLCMTRQEWGQVHVGDFIALDHEALDVENNSGSLYLSVEQQKLFRVRIKSHGLKILEQSIYQEEATSMDNEQEDLLSEISDLEQSRKESIDPIPADEELEEFEENEPDSDSAEQSIVVTPEKASLEKIEKVPLNIVVEVARFKMTCEKLMQLKPGNLLELNVSLEKPVDLVVNGRKIATGELVRVGETLGVQILKIG